jgi:lysophospholipase L1-like esterase
VLADISPSHGATAAKRGLRVIRAAVAVVAVLVALPAGVAYGAAPPTEPSPCAAPPTPTAVFDATTRLGVIDLAIVGAQGVPVTFFECIGGRAVELGRRTAPQEAVATYMLDATTWRCGRLTRRFAASATLADGSVVRSSTATRTPSCAQRLDLEVPRRLRPGAVARVRMSDRWKVGGVRASLCIAPPGRRAICRQVVFLRDKLLALRRFRVAARGRWRVELRVPGHTTRVTIAVGVRAVPDKRLPTLLATGDSTMDLLSSFLSDQLSDEANVVSEVEPGLTISKDDAFQPLAVKQVARLKPATTVVSIGFNEGWGMRGPDGVLNVCCDAGWIAEYARRVRRTMLTYGHRVLWLTVFAPKDPRRTPMADAVNVAIIHAADGLPDVHVIRMDLLFTPNGYRDAIRYGGHDVYVREPDGVHLNVAGAQIAAREVVKALHAMSGG